MPLTYKRVQEHKSVLSMYASRLEEQGLIAASAVHDMRVSLRICFSDCIAALPLSIVTRLVLLLYACHCKRYKATQTVPAAGEF